MAPTPLAAAMLARATTCPGIAQPVLQREELRNRLAKLSLSCLTLAPKQAALLARIGIRQLDELLRLPRAEVARRIHIQLPALLDRLLGQAPDPRPMFTPPTRYTNRLSLPVDVTETAPLLFAARRLLAELSAALLSRCAGIQTLRWQLQHPNQLVTAINFELTLPVNDDKQLLMLLRERLTRQPLSAPVREIGLVTGQFVRLTIETLPLLPGTTHDAATGDAIGLVERLHARLGSAAVYGLCKMAEHRPERAWQPCPPTLTASLTPVFPPRSGAQRPLWLLTTPLPLPMRDRQPWLDGQLTLIPGSERINSGWWEGQDVRRDYFRALSLKGEYLWLFYTPNGPHRWYLHGLFG